MVPPKGIRDVSRTPHRVRRGAACLAGLACLLGLAACGTGVNAQTNQSYQAAAGSNEREADVDVMNILAVENTDGLAATISAGVIAKGQDDAGDTLTGVSGTDGEGNELDVQLDAPVELPDGELVTLGEEPEITLSGDAVEAGYYVTLDLQFETAAPVEVEVPVVERGEEGTYDSVAEAPAPEESDSDSQNG